MTSPSFALIKIVPLQETIFIELSIKKSGAKNFGLEYAQHGAFSAPHARRDKYIRPKSRISKKLPAHTVAGSF